MVVLSICRRTTYSDRRSIVLRGIVRLRFLLCTVVLVNKLKTLKVLAARLACQEVVEGGARIGSGLGRG